MTYYIGIDGGGTKTAFALADGQGKILNNINKASTSYKHAGWEGTLKCIGDGVEELLTGIHINRQNVYICFGAPNYGESKEFDKKLKDDLEKVLSGYHLYLVNDSEVGWAGSLGLKPGINIVAGTGTIGLGKDAGGRKAIAGGWSDFFGDEGSCRWLGVKAMELFSKQADGRAVKGPLYDVVMDYFKVETPMDIIDIFEADYQPYRNKLAGLQRLMFEAAKRGDELALLYYKKAAHELALIITAVYCKLEFHEECTVSYSGGLFKTGELILTPLREELKEYNMKICRPLYPPVTGAVMLAGEMAGGRLCI